jgi:uncharacterized protein
LPLVLNESKKLLEEQAEQNVSWQTVLEQRFIHGGLPQFFLTKTLNDAVYLEWLDSFWAKDLQELFVVEKRASFEMFLQLLLKQSGELFESTAFSAPCGVSRQTIQNYLQILETTLLIVQIKPYFKLGASEIKSQPKVFGFDTGFVSWLRGWTELNEFNRGTCLEHLTLNELLSVLPKENIFYWRNKAKNEVDFIVKTKRGLTVHAIECKSHSSKFKRNGVEAFRKIYPEGKNFVVCFDALEIQERILDNFKVLVVPIWLLVESVMA